MSIETKYNPILITGVERSGSTLVARILDMCGVWSGDCNKMFENKEIFGFKQFRSKTLFPHTARINIIKGWDQYIINKIKLQGWDNQSWMLKNSKLAQFWPIWFDAFPDAKWLIIRRRTGDVVHSCMKTGYMKLFKNHYNLEVLGIENELEGWLWWVRQYEKKFIEMTKEGLNYKVIWPDRMVTGDYEQIKEVVNWLGLEWNEKIPDTIYPLLEKSRRLKNGKDECN
jgi:hypothetical protein